jgi:hypothetical protein
VALGNFYMASFIRFLKRKRKLFYDYRVALYERLADPLHINALSLVALLSNSLRRKIDFDLVLRKQHAFALLNLADQAKRLGVKSATVIEFGVASGAGLLNLQNVSKRITKLTGIAFSIVGFDTGQGMPPPQSYKDHPELYQAGDFPMDFDALSKLLDKNVELIIGPLDKTIADFASRDFARSPIGFVSIDVDYYSSTMDALKVFEGPADNFFPRIIVWLDDIGNLNHNSKCGELAAILDFSHQHPLRPIERHPSLRNHRIFKNAPWIDHIYQCHVLDHPIRNTLNSARPQNVATNAFLK